MSPECPGNKEYNGYECDCPGQKVEFGDNNCVCPGKKIVRYFVLLNKNGPNKCLSVKDTQKLISL